MTVSDFLGFFSKNHFLEGALFINWRGSILSGAEEGGGWGESIDFDEEDSKKS